MNAFTFKIVTPERVVFEKQVSQVTLPTALGEITVLPNHIPLVSSMMAGEISLKDEHGKEEFFSVSGGFAEVYPRAFVILADTAEMAHELDEARATEAHRRAAELLHTRAGSMDHDYAALKVLMDKELARLKVARRHKVQRARLARTP